MILYIFNQFLFDNSGFSKRCQKEIKILSKYEKVIVICRKSNHYGANIEINNVEILNFNHKIPLFTKHKRYISFLDEFYRTFLLYINLLLFFIKLGKKINFKDVSMLYVINSPLTFSLICFIFSKAKYIKQTVLEFHDLEPEMAKHVKKINGLNFVLFIEYFMEKYLCHKFKKIVVTNSIQKNKLIERTKIEKDKIFVLPNTIQINKNLKVKNKKDLINGIDEKDFVVGYLSTLDYDYTVDGLIALLEKIKPTISKYNKIKLVIIGNGIGLKSIKAIIKKFDLNNNVILLGKLKDTENLLAYFDIGIIPWLKSAFSETILPTKLFEYLESNTTTIVPDFGDFPNVINNNVNGMTFDSIDNLISKIIDLYLNPHKKLKFAVSGFKLFSQKYSLDYFTNNYIKFLNL